MRIVDLLKKEAVVLNADVSEKEQMLEKSSRFSNFSKIFFLFVP